MRRFSYQEGLWFIGIFLLFFAAGYSPNAQAVKPSITTQPQNQTALVGANAGFKVISTGSTPLKYQWYFNSAKLTDSSHIGGSTTTNLVLTGVLLNDAGSYYVVVTNQSGMVTSAVATLTVLAPVTITNQPANHTVTTGSNTTFTVGAQGTQPLGYQWQFNGVPLTNSAHATGVTTATLTVSNVSADDAGNYRVIVTNSVNSVTSSVAVLTVVFPPAITNQPASQFVIVSNSANFTVGTSGTEPLSYQWRRNVTNLSGATGNSFSLTQALGADAGNYDVIVTNAYGSITSMVAALTVLFPVTITNQPTGRTVMVGSNTTFTVGVQGTQPLSYQWQFNGRPLTNSSRIGGVTTSTLSISDVSAGDDGIYQVVVTNSINSVTSSVAVLTVVFPPSIFIQPTNRVALLGNTTVYSVTGMGTEALFYKWRKDGTNIDNNWRISGVTTSTLTISNTQMSDIGNYQVEISNAFGVATSTSASLSVVPIVVWGDTAYGQTDIPSKLTNAVAIAAQGYTAEYLNLGLKSDRTIFGWGYYYNGETSIYFGETNIPVGLSNVVSISAGFRHGLALKSDGSVVGLGDNQFGETTIPSGLNDVVNVAAGGLYSLALKKNGTVVGWGNNKEGQAIPPDGLSNVVSIAAGLFHSLAIKNDGTVVGWGYNTSGQVTTPAGLSNVIAVSAGSHHSLALKSDGDVVAWGYNYYGQADVPTGLSNVIAIAAGYYHSLALKRDGTIVVWGNNNSGQATPPAGLSNVVAIAGGNNHSVALVQSPVAQFPPAITWLGSTNRIVASGQTTIFLPSVAGSLPMSFQWLFNGAPLLGQSNAWLILPSIQPYQAGNYQLIVSNKYGAATSDVAAVFESPAIVTQPSNQVVLIGGNVSFDASFIGVEPLGYQWFFKGVPLADNGHISGSATTNLVIVGVQSSDSGNYTVVVTNAWGAATSTVAVLEVLVPPSFALMPLSQTNRAGSNVTFAATVSGTQPIGYQWLFNAAPLSDDAHIAGANSNTLTFTGVQPSHAGDYQLVASNVVGVVTSAVASLTVLVTPSIIQPPISQIVSNSATVSFSAVATGSVPLVYRWYFNGAPLVDNLRISGSTTTNLIVVDAQYSNSGNYSVVVTNIAGTATSAVAVLTVYSPPIFTTTPASRTNAVGSNTVFTANVTGSQPITYQWLLNGVELTNSSHVSGAASTNLAIIALTTNDIGNYQLLATNSYGSVTSAAVFLDVQFPPAFTQTPVGQTNAVGAVVAFTTITTGSAPLSYQWCFNNVAMTNSARINGSDTSTLVISNLQMADAGNYKVNVTNLVGAASSSNVVLAVIPPPVITLQPINKIGAVGSNIAFSVGVRSSTPPGYQWYFSGMPLTNNSHYSGTDTNVLTILVAQTNDIGDYQAVVTNVSGSVTSSVANLNLLYPPVIVTPPLSQNVDASSNVTFSVVVSGAEPFAYRWRFNGVNLVNSARISGSTNDTLTISNLVFADTGNYDVVVTNLVGATTSPSAGLVVNIAPVITSQPTDRAIALGQQLNLAAVATGTTPLYFQWSLNGADLPTGTNTTYSVPAVTTNDYGIYKLIVANAFGSATSAPVTISPSKIVAWGNNNNGQTNLPLDLTNIIAISAGGDVYGLAGGSSGHNLVLRADGTLFAWGNNSSGQTNVPANATNIVAIAAGGRHNLALRADGTVIAWGYNNSGQTNVPSTLSNVVAIAAGYLHSVALRSDGKVFAWGSSSSGQTAVPSNLGKIVSIAAGALHTLAVCADGTAIAFGNTLGESQSPPGPVPAPANLGDVTSVSGGYFHSLAARSNGTVVVWGSTNYNKLIFPANLTNTTTVAAGTYFSLALRANSLVSAWGLNDYGQTNIPAGLSNVVAIAAGPAHALALVNDGRPIITRMPVGGVNYMGRSHTLSAQVAGNAPLALQWQFNGVDIPGATTDTLLLNNLSLANSGSYQLLATNSLGSTASLPVPLTVLSNSAIAFSSTLPSLGTNFVGAKLWLNAAVSGNGPVKWQWRFNGTNIPSATNEDFVIEPLMVTNGGNYSVIASNYISTISSISSSQRVSLVRMWGYSPADPPANITNVVAMSVGFSGVGSSYGYNWTLRSDGKLAGWGQSFSGENYIPASVSNSVVTAIASGYGHALALRSDGMPIVWGYYSSSTNIPADAANSIAVACGDNTDMVLRTDGTVIVWGNNTYQQTQVPTNATNVVAIAAGQNHCLALRADGQVVGWGYSSAWYPLPASLTNIIAIAAGVGANYSVALRADGTVVVWGGKTTVPADWTNIVAIASGYNHVTALRADGTVTTSGNYYSGTSAVPADTANVIAIASSSDRDLALFGPRAPAITVQPFSRSIFRGSNTLFVCKTVSPAPASYQWLFNGVPIAGATNDNYSLTNAQFSHAGSYSLVVSNRYGVATSKAAKFTVTLPLAVALDTEIPPVHAFVWASTGNALWFGQTNVSHDSVDAARSGEIGAFQETILTAQTNYISGGSPNVQISFWWKVSSEAGFDTLEFRQNGNLLATISGEVNWEQRIFPLASGTNILQWRYSKDATGNSGSDAAWVDQITLLPGAPVILSQPTSRTVNVSNATSFSISVNSAVPVAYRWRHNGANPVGPNSSQLTLINVGRANRGTYSCLVSNIGGVTISSNATLNVLVPQKLGTMEVLSNGMVAFTSGDVDGGLLSTGDLTGFTLQASIDLTSWTTLSNALTLTNGLLRFQDFGQSNYPARYYRLLEY